METKRGGASASHKGWKQHRQGATHCRNHTLTFLESYLHLHQHARPHLKKQCGKGTNCPCPNCWTMQWQGARTLFVSMAAPICAMYMSMLHICKACDSLMQLVTLLETYTGCLMSLSYTKAPTACTCCNSAVCWGWMAVVFPHIR